MTEQLDSMQQLLIEVKQALREPSPPLWAIYRHATAQRQLLVRVQEVLGLLVSRSAVLSASPVSLAGISQDLQQLRGTLLVPLQQEVQQLGQKRSALQAEIADLERQLAAAQNQLNSTQRVGNSSVNLSANPLVNPSLASIDISESEAQIIHDRATQLIGQLDSTIQLSFRALDQDVQTYRIALTRQLEQLYDLGQRSESVIATLLQQVIDEAQQAAQRYAAAVGSAQLPVPAPLMVMEPIASQTESLEGSGSLGSLFPPVTSSASPAAVDEIRTLTELLRSLGLPLPTLVNPSLVNPSLVNPSLAVADPADDSGRMAADDFTLTGFNDLFAAAVPDESTTASRIAAGSPIAGGEC